MSPDAKELDEGELVNLQFTIIGNSLLANRLDLPTVGEEVICLRETPGSFLLCGSNIRQSVPVVAHIVQRGAGSMFCGIEELRHVVEILRISLVAKGKINRPRIGRYGMNGCYDGVVKDAILASISFKTSQYFLFT